MTPTQIQASIIPRFVYLEDGTLMIQENDSSPEKIESINDLGQIIDAVFIDENLFLLREQGLELIQTTEGKSDILMHFDMPIIQGNFFPDSSRHRVFYSTKNDLESIIGYYALDEDTIHTILTFPQSLYIVGLTEDGQGLYGVPFGQDPDFNKVLLIDVGKGQISEELPVHGTSYAALAPDARRFTTFALVDEPSGQVDGIINLYDLPSLPLTPPQVFLLPKTPGYVGFGGMRWSPNSHNLYFMFIENIYDAPATTSYGLWRLDTSSGKMEEVSPITDPIFHTISVSPDGMWILLSHERKNVSIMVNADTGVIQSITVPVGAIFAGWK
jgi:hypothetical protein